MRDKKKPFNRYIALVIIMVMIFSGIGSRLFYVQIVKGADYAQKANSGSIREIPDAAPRGKILDKNGTVLATNIQSYELVYNETPEIQNSFFTTMTKVFKLLDENGETQQDDFELKVNPYRFEFAAQDEAGKRTLQIRFLRNRGFNESIEKKLYPKIKSTDLTDDQKNKVNEELLKLTPEEVYKKLLIDYKIPSSYDAATQRKFMLIKDKMKMQSFSGYKPIVIANIKQQTSSIFYQLLYELPGIDVSIQPIRSYPYGDVGSAFLGYISKITTNDTKYDEKGYDTSTDYIGAAGIESTYESRLKGSKGGRIVKLNKNGRIIEELGSREPYPGQNIQLTIDEKLQNTAEKALDSVMANLRANAHQISDVNTSNATRGAAVVVNVKTGAVLALASRPGYDPNIFATPGKLTSDLYKQYFQPDLAQFGKSFIQNNGLMSYYPGKTLDQVLNILFPIDTSIKGNTTIRKDQYDIYARPMYNYATLPLVPPGSTFKPMTAIAGLESGAITPGFTMVDDGTFDKGGGNITRFAVGGYGAVDLYKALAVSSNPYFMTVGKKIREAYNNNDDILAKYAWRFGLGVDPTSNAKASTGIEIQENFGQVYNTWSNKEIFGRNYTWTVMETLKSGTTHNGAKFTPVNLYDSDSDSSEVKNYKTQIKDECKNIIKTGKYSESKLNQLLTGLINADSTYNGKNISGSDISTMVKEIVYITYSDAYMQVRPFAGSNMYDASIGQGIDSFTPLQLVNYVATIANGGTRYKLHLLDKITDADGKLIEQVQPEIAEKTNVSAANLNAVKQGMYLVNNSGEDGTAANTFAGFPIKTAGKTGSATVNNNQSTFGRTSSAVYVGFAPYEDPQIAVCVMVFDGGHGGSIAPVAKAIYEQYFSDELKKDGYTPQFNFNNN